MRRLRGEERWAQACIQTALGVDVQPHDDGSLPSMYDLKIIYPDRPPAAVEISAAADSEAIELWNLVNGDGERWQDSRLIGGWIASFAPTARAKKIGAQLPDLLAEFERRGITVYRELEDTDPLAVRARSLQLVHASQGRTNFPGSIYITLDLPPERTGGAVPRTGDSLASWVGDWLAQPDQADVRRKLHSSGLPERHAFVIFPGFTPAPFGVIDILMRPDGPLPTIPPGLPPEVTHVWALGTWGSGHGFRWTPQDGWSRFDQVTVIDSRSPERSG